MGVDARAGRAAFGDEAGAFEHADMAGDGGTADREMRRDFAGRPLTAAQQVENGPPGRVGNGGKAGFVMYCDVCNHFVTCKHKKKRRQARLRFSVSVTVC